MAFDNTNRGTIAKNAHKTEDKHPDIAGTVNVEGKDFWINGWLKKNSRDGSSFYSLTVKPKQERAAEIRQATKPRYGDAGEYRRGQADPDTGELDDTIPF